MIGSHWATNDAVVSMRGGDVRTWANGLFTNNVRDMKVGAWHRSAMLDERGRIQGLMSLGCVDESTLIAVLDGQDFQAFEDRYRMHAMLDDITLSSPDWLVHTLQGDLPDLGEFVRSGGLVVPHQRGPADGVDLVGDPDWIAAVTAALGEPLPLLEREVQRIRAGLPSWPADFNGKNLCHEMGLRDGYLSFDKGCYLGQETVMRVDVRGQVKKHLRGFSLDGEPSEMVIQSNGRKVGTLTSHVLAPDLGWIGLGVVKDEAAVGTTVQLGEVQGTVIQLPFGP